MGKPNPPDRARPTDDLHAVSSGIFALVSALFFLSGFAGLVYQVLWMRNLGLVFGSDIYGITTILSTFMGGLALGSVIGGILTERTGRPLFWYGVAEMGIGAFALCFSPLVESLDPLLKASYARIDAEPTFGYHALRTALAAGALLVPTTLMGATLPLIMRYFVRARSVMGELAAHFYSLNTLGALAGTLIAGFILLPRLGMSLSTLCVALVNFAIGAVCSVVGWRAIQAPVSKIPPTSDLDSVPEIDPLARRRIARAALVAFACSGFASFALEVVWTRILIASFSATVYCFASMLACFLFGIFLGSRLIGPRVDQHPNPIALFSALELGAGVSVALLCVVTDVVPGSFGRLMSGVANALGPAREYTLVISTLVASFLLLLIPTTLIGATFPVALRTYTTNVARVGSRTGYLYGANTLGAIAGSLVAGLILIPSIGPSASLAIIALAFCAIGACLSSCQPRAERSISRTRVIVAGLATFGLVAISLATPYRVTLNFNQQSHANALLLYHADGVQNTIDLVRSKSGTTALIIGGNVEADDSYRQRRHFILKGHLPLMLHEKPRSVLVIGLGMGITLQTSARHPGVEQIDVIELSPEIVEAQAYLREINGDILHNPAVRVRIDDGRLFMKMSEARYDMITADPIHPKIARVGYLYTREYYESIRDRLADGGVVCQWMPIYQISPTRLRSALKTFIDVFPNATLWYVEGHALLVAKRDDAPIDFARLEQGFGDDSVRSDLESIDIPSPEHLLSHLLMGPAEIRAFVEDEPGVPTNTDDYPYLEYYVPGDLFYRTIDNTRALAAHLGNPIPLVANLPGESAALVEEFCLDREHTLLHVDGEPSSSEPPLPRI